MKILVVGAFGSKQRDAAILEGFRICGADVRECGYGDILYNRQLVSRLQFRFGVGYVFNKIKAKVINSCREFKADIIFFRRPLEFSSQMLQEIRHTTGARLVSFNNDDPFSAAYRDIRWVKLRSAIKDFDMHFAFRRCNLKQYAEFGAKEVSLWEPYYVPWLHRPLVAENTWQQYKNQILFAMHAEKDERREAVHKIKSNGFNLNVYSWNWGKLFGDAEAEALRIKKPIWEDEYVKEIGKSMASLCFFSKQNNDELTSRVFEIPACLGLLVSYRTGRLEEIYANWKDAIFFNDVDELLDILTFLACNPAIVTKIKAAGHARLLRSGHSVVDRCQNALHVMRG